MTKGAGGSWSPAAVSSVSKETPLHSVSSFDQVVTQWMSTTTLGCGRAWDSAHGAAGDATDDLRLRQRLNPGPRPLREQRAALLRRERPRREVDLRRRSCGQDWEIIDQMLTRRHARAPRVGRAAPSESPRDRWVVRHMSAAAPGL